MRDYQDTVHHWSNRTTAPSKGLDAYFEDKAASYLHDAAHDGETPTEAGMHAYLEMYECQCDEDLEWNHEIEDVRDAIDAAVDAWVRGRK